ncbi:MAG TPA: hypothetical protein VGQ35_08250 [Dongiaceae bacterium]|nr:hypothetical protein [Dongiaceae bacterium]
MKIHLFIAAIAALSLAALAVTFAATIVPIQGRYSKTGLDGICAVAGGKSYGSTNKAYGCSKGTVTVECRKDGACTGYVYFQIVADGPMTSDPAALLQHSSNPKRVTTSAGDELLTQQ